MNILLDNIYILYILLEILFFLFQNGIKLTKKINFLEEFFLLMMRQKLLKEKILFFGIKYLLLMLLI